MEMGAKTTKRILKAYFPTIFKYLRKAIVIYGRLLAEKQRKKLLDLVKQYYKTPKDQEVIAILLFLETNAIEMIPYEFKNEFKAQKIVIKRDDKSKYPYVIIGGNKE